MKETEKTIITGGHFRLNEEQKPHLNAGTINSFRSAVRLSTNIEGSVGLLVNDIGHDASIRETFRLPPEYKSILEEYDTREEELIILWEKTFRNQASRLLRAKIKQKFPFVIKDETYFYKNPSTEQLTSVGRVSQSKYPTPTCPLIASTMTRHFEDLGFTHNSNIYYTGTDNKFNVPNRSVDCGNQLKELTGQKIAIDNIFTHS